MTDSDNIRTIWRDTLESIKVSVSEASFNTWFMQTHLSKLKKSNGRYIAEIGCSSPYAKSEIEKRYFGAVQDTLAKTLEAPCDIIFLIKDDPSKKKESLDDVPLFEKKKDSRDESQAIDLSKKANLRLYFTFKNFAVSSSNQMAYAAAEAVSKSLGTAYNPLFIWGGVGVGKTHLMNAVGHSALAQNPEANVLCCTGEQFTNDIVEGIRKKTTPEVRAKYRKLDALLIDDIQFIAGKDSVQEEFFHTFNSLVGARSQVIMTSDKQPSEITRLEERLKSRFEAGLIVDIAPSDFELRCAITQIKSKDKEIPLEMDQVQLIAGNLDTARKIEGILTKLLTEITLNKKPLTSELIEEHLGKGIEEIAKIRATPNQVISAVSKHFSLGKRKLLGSSRTRPVARPRQMLMYILRTQLQLPFQEVGRIVGGRDHTTAMHAVDKITHLASNDVNIREDLRGIRNML